MIKKNVFFVLIFSLPLLSGCNFEFSKDIEKEISSIEQGIIDVKRQLAHLATIDSEIKKLETDIKQLKESIAKLQQKNPKE